MLNLKEKYVKQPKIKMYCSIWKWEIIDRRIDNKKM
jgi:hypothetical protein